MAGMAQKKYEYLDKQFQKAIRRGKQPNGYYLAEKISRPGLPSQCNYRRDVESGSAITLGDLKQWAASKGYTLDKPKFVARSAYAYEYGDDRVVESAYFLPRAEQQLTDGSWSKLTDNGGKKEGSEYNGTTQMFRKGVWDNDKFTGWQFNTKTHKRIRVENNVLKGDWEWPGCDETADIYNDYLDMTLSDKDKAEKLAVGKSFFTSRGKFYIILENEVKFENYDNRNAVDIVIPSTVSYLGKNFVVTELKVHAFEFCNNLKSVVIPSTVRKIGVSAFSGCKSLESVVIPNSVEIIESNAFHYCESLKSVILPNSLKKIGNGAFSWCTSLMPFALPPSCTEVGDRLFDHCLESYDVDCDNINQYCNKLKNNKELTDYEVSVLDRFVKSYSSNPAKDVKKKLPLAKELVNVNKVVTAMNLEFEKLNYYHRPENPTTKAWSVYVNVQKTTAAEYSRKILQEGLNVVKTTKSQFGFSQLYQKALQRLPQRFKEFQEFERIKMAEFEREAGKDRAKQADEQYRYDMAAAIDKGKVQCPKYVVKRKGDSYHVIRWEDGTEGRVVYDSKEGWYVWFGGRIYYKTYAHAVKALYVVEKYHVKAHDGLK